MDTFDPYSEWLGIPPAEQPAHYYRLLGLPLFESDAARIQAEADVRMQHVRKFQLGKRSQASQKILNELAAARVCLLDAGTKVRYDAALSQWLTARLPVAPPVLPAEAPPLLSPDVRALLPGQAPSLLPGEAEETAQPPTRPPAIAAAPKAPPGPRRRAYSGWLIVAGAVTLTAGILALIYWKNRAGHGPLTSSKAVYTDEGGNVVEIKENVVVQPESGDLELQAVKGKVAGKSLKLDGEAAVGFSGPDDQLSWEILIRKPGVFQVIVEYAADSSAVGGEFRLAISGEDRKSLMLSVRHTGGRDSFVKDPLSKMAGILKPGPYTLTLSASGKTEGESMKLRNVKLQLVPTGRGQKGR